MRRAILVLPPLLLAAILAIVPSGTPVRALTWTPPDVASKPPGRPRVLVIGLDGVRADVLVDATVPHLTSLGVTTAARRGALTCVPTLSGPGWASMLTGVWPDKHRIRSNDLHGHDLATYPDFLTRLERENPRVRTFAAASWAPLVLPRGGGPLLGDGVDQRLVFDGDTLGYAVADWKVVAAATRLLAETDVDAGFVYLGNIDVVGHETGVRSRAYRDAIEVGDRQVGKLLAALRRRPHYDAEDWLVLVTTDHGRRDDGGHGGDSDVERRIFLVVSGDDLVPRAGAASPAIVDVAPTALAHLGVFPPSDWNLDGHAVGLHRRAPGGYRSAHDGSGAARPLSP